MEAGRLTEIRGGNLRITKKDLALVNPMYFGLEYLGMGYYGCQHEWTKHFGETRFFHAAPRDHGKSHIYSYLLPLWEIVRNPNIRITLVSKTFELACRFIGSIKAELENNEKIIRDFG